MRAESGLIEEGGGGGINFTSILHTGISIVKDCCHNCIGMFGIAIEWIWCGLPVKGTLTVKYFMFMALIRKVSFDEISNG